jgi:hypothetical protein
MSLHWIFQSRIIQGRRIPRTGARCINGTSVTDFATDFNRILRQGALAFQSDDSQKYETCLRLGGKALRSLALNGQIDLALSLEPSWYNSLVKKIETERNYRESFRWHTQAFWDIGVQQGRPNPTERAANQKVAFLAHTGALLGHTEVMLRIIEGWRQTAPHLQPYFISFGGMSPDLRAKLTALSVPHAVVPVGLTPRLSCGWARQLIATNDISTAVWLSTPCMVSYAFGFGVAQRQILWSLKFHAVHLGPNITHVGMTKPTVDNVVVINGAPWKAFSPPLTLSLRKQSRDEICSLRKKWEGAFLFGTLAREEKFNSPSFIGAVVRILKSTPGSHYLYTGKQRPGMLEQALAQADLQERATFVGWVDTNLYAQAIDTFLETFPFGCGVTGAQAVEHGTPVISLWDEDTLPRFYFPTLAQAQYFSPKWKISDTVDQYVQHAVAAAAAAEVGVERLGSQNHVVTTEQRPSLAQLDAAKPEQLRDLFGLPAS